MACYSDSQMAAALRLAGVGVGDAAYLVATAHPESGGCDVIQQGQPYGTTGWGVWQITPGNSVPSAGVNNALLNLKTNAEAAAAKLSSQGLGAWTTITSGKYLPYFPAAKLAVANVYGMSASQVSQLANSAGSGGASTTAAQTTSLGSDIGSTLLSGLTSALGLPNAKDMLVRLGFIVLGGLLVIVGIMMLVGKQAIQVGIEAAAPESRAALATSPSTSRAKEARTRARQAKSNASES